VFTPFTVAFMTDVQCGAPGHHGGYVWGEAPTMASYCPSNTYTMNTATPTVCIAQPSRGEYIVRFPY